MFTQYVLISDEDSQELGRLTSDQRETFEHNLTQAAHLEVRRLYAERLKHEQAKVFLQISEPDALILKRVLSEVGWSYQWDNLRHQRDRCAAILKSLDDQLLILRGGA